MNGPEYANQLMAEIEEAKSAGRNGVFKIMEKLDDSTAIYARDYISSHTPYRVDFHKCQQCAFEWDIVIVFQNIKKQLTIRNILDKNMEVWYNRGYYEDSNTGRQ